MMGDVLKTLERAKMAAQKRVAIEAAYSKKWNDNYEQTMKRYSGNFTDKLDNHQHDGVE